MEISKTKLFLVLSNSVVPDKTLHNLSNVNTKKIIIIYLLQDFVTFDFDVCKEL